MPVSSRWKAFLLRSPAYLLLAGSRASTMRKLEQRHQQSSGCPPCGKLAKRPSGRAGGDGVDEAGGGGGSWWWMPWLRLLRRRVVVACRPRNVARILGAVLVAALLAILLTKGLSSRRRGSCRCTKFSYSQCQPYDGGNCGQGTKKAFCQQRRCHPRRKLVRCSVPCRSDAANSVELRKAKPPVCVYAPRRQSRWTRCTGKSKHRSRLLFLQISSSVEGVSADDMKNICPPTKSERRRCKSKPRRPKKSCIYEPRGTWSACDRGRNEIVNTRKLVGGTANNCPVELKATVRCLKRDGSLKCIYSKWSQWTRCTPLGDGSGRSSRQKTRILVQGGSRCEQPTNIEQHCPGGWPPLEPPLPEEDADTVVIRK